MQLKIGVVSDLHCHNKEKNDDKQESYILTDVESSLYQHPHKSFKEFMKDNSQLSVDILLSPGDFSNKSDEEGLKLGWNITKEIGKLLKAKQIIPNIGNHDVDSRNKFGKGSFHFVKNIKNFPFKNSIMNNEFWNKGYILIEETEYRLLVVNSVHSHINEDQATHGLISQESINELEKELNKINDNKLNIAMCHHNPIEHSHFDSGNKDFMYNGDELISLLDKFNFDLIIHGHKHDPRIRYAQGGGNAPVIFSAGSFSAFRSSILQGGHNTFHIITLEINKHQVGKGIIDTWFFIPTKGWKQEVKNQYFDAKVGFGAVLDLRATSNQILQWFQKSQQKFIDWETFLITFPDLRYVIPSDFDKLKLLLKGNNIYITPKQFDEPSFIHFKS